MRIKYYNLLSLLIIFTIVGSSFVTPTISKTKNTISNTKQKRQKELKRLNKSIKDTRKKILKLNRKEKVTLNLLNTNQNHSFVLNKYILLLDEQINELQKEINEHDSLYYQLCIRQKKIRNEYAELARKIYLSGNTSNIEILLSENTFDEDIIHEIYVKKLAGHFRQNMNTIDLIKIAISNETGFLKDKEDYQSELQSIKSKEKRNLDYGIAKNKKILKKIKKDSKYLKRQLTQKQKSAKKVKKIIADLIKQEMKKLKGAVKSLPIGKISWPVNSKRIFRKFGKVKNKETNTYFDNPGIDISTKSGSVVKAVANGEVSMIHWLPGYGTLLILNHGNGLRTVYANLSSVWLKKGERIKKGKGLGKSGESVEGEFLHFELWSGDKRLNPSHYLR